MFDILIKNSTIFDGSGMKPYIADIGICDGKIKSIIKSENVSESKKIINAEGLITSPGFIDIHTHSDISLYIDPRGMSKIMQGVTTDVTGNCGYSPFPVNPKEIQNHRSNLNSIHGEDIEWEWTNLDEYRNCLEKKGIGMNIAPLLGHSSIRGSTIGFIDKVVLVTQNH